MKKILLIAKSDSSNLGDQLISELIYELCKKFADTPQVTLAPALPTYQCY